MLVVAALLQSVQPASAQPAPVQGARLIITPAEPMVVAEDTLRLQARVVDASGQPVPTAQIRFVAAGGVFEGRVDPDGLVRSGSTGTLPVTIVAQILSVHAHTACGSAHGGRSCGDDHRGRSDPSGGRTTVGAGTGGEERGW